MSSQPPDVLPATAGDIASTLPSFRSDLRAEFARLFRPPRTEVTSIVADGLAVTAAWLLLPAAIHDWLFRLSGPMAFAVVLQAWMLGDTSVTNVLGNDVPAALDAVRDPDRFARLLRVKGVAIATLVAVPCAVVAAVLAAVQGDYLAGLLLCAVVLVAPFGAVSMAQWVGIRWPYHPQSLRWRWERRHSLRSSLRWLILIVVPFLVVPAILAMLLAGGIAAGAVFGGRDGEGHLDATGLVITAALAVLLSVAVHAVAPRVSAALARRRQAPLTEILANPDHG